METTIDEAVLGLDVNHGYIAVIMGDNVIDVHLVAEHCVLGSTSSLIIFLASLLRLSFTFNIVYPKPLISFMYFLQHTYCI